MGRPKKPRPPCLHCGDPVNRPGNTYCSNSCQQARSREQRAGAVRRTGDIKQGFNRAEGVRWYLTQRDGHRCSVCGIEEWQGQPAPLVMDHIDGDASNWSDNNLRLVCGNCDMQLPTYKGKNKGRGRHQRRLRYQAGKSY